MKKKKKKKVKKIKKKKLKKSPVKKKILKIKRKRKRGTARRSKIVSKKTTKKKHLLVNLLRFQENIRLNIKNNFKINLEEKIKSFFDFIDNKIDQYKLFIKEEKQRIKLETYEKEHLTF